MAGIDDMSLPLSRFAILDLACRQVIVTENKINGLAFPPLADSLVVFGLGYGIGLLAGVPWLNTVGLHYWGDIDTHGFAILSRLRAVFPRTRSFLMDEATLERNRDLWGCEQEPCLDELDHLTAEEQAVYDGLRANTHGRNLRLEQERIGYGQVLNAARKVHFLRDVAVD